MKWNIDVDISKVLRLRRLELMMFEYYINHGLGRTNQRRKDRQANHYILGPLYKQVSASNFWWFQAVGKSMKWEFSELVNKYVNPPVPTLEEMSNLTFWEGSFRGDTKLRDGIKAYKQLLHIYNALGVKLDTETHPMVGEGF